MQVSYAITGELGGPTKSIFLAGPTPRSDKVSSWRPEALEYLKDFDGVVYVPEPEDGIWFDDYIRQVEWERMAMEMSTTILFWIERSLWEMPAFTTNVEYGYWIAKNPEKIVLGYPKFAQKMKYIQYWANRLDIPSFNVMKEACDYAIQFT